MKRLFLALMLMAFAALPRGVCICEYFGVEGPHPDAFSHDDHSQRHDEPTRDDDCTCKNREVLACQPTANLVERDCASSFHECPRNILLPAPAEVSSTHFLDACHAASFPAALAMRALRI